MPCHTLENYNYKPNFGWFTKIQEIFLRVHYILDQVYHHWYSISILDMFDKKILVTYIFQSISKIKAKNLTVETYNSDAYSSLKHPVEHLVWNWATNFFTFCRHKNTKRIWSENKVFDLPKPTSNDCGVGTIKI